LHAENKEWVVSTDASPTGTISVKTIHHTNAACGSWSAHMSFAHTIMVTNTTHQLQRQTVPAQPNGQLAAQPLLTWQESTNLTLPTCAYPRQNHLLYQGCTRQFHLPAQVAHSLHEQHHPSLMLLPLQSGPEKPHLNLPSNNAPNQWVTHSRNRLLLARLLLSLYLRQQPQQLLQHVLGAGALGALP
jgi:hypothetical protein